MAMDGPALFPWEGETSAWWESTAVPLLGALAQGVTAANEYLARLRSRTEEDGLDRLAPILAVLAGDGDGTDDADVDEDPFTPLDAWLKSIDPDQARIYQSETIPAIAALALEGPALLRSHPGLDARDAGAGDADTGTASAFLVPPLALTGDEGVGRFDSGTAWRMSLSRRACASVVALAVLSLFRGTATRAVLTGTELFRPLRFRKAQAAKVEALLVYFGHHGAEGGDNGDDEDLVVFERSVLARPTPREADWRAFEMSLCPLVVSDDQRTKIDDADGYIQVDFAGDVLGGGVFGSGCAQEEMMFATSPACIVAMLLFPRLEDHEAINIVNARQHVQYKGYGSRFRLVGPLETDPCAAKARVIAAMDALYNPGATQFGTNFLLRECNKALAAFLPHASADGMLGIATGNWGCGAYAGDPQLKSLVQWMAASVAGAPEVLYFAFGNDEVADLAEVAAALADRYATVGALFGAVVDAGSARLQAGTGRLFELMAAADA